MATRIGCDNLVYALMTTEDTATTAPVYSAPVAATGVMSVNINPNAAQETLFADDGPMETATTLGKIEVEIQKNALTTQNKADLLGHKIDADGAVVYGDSDVAPWVAIGFRTLKSNGNYRYVWLYKGKFQDPEDQNETKGDGINFQADTIKGQFVKLNNSYTVSGTPIRPWKYEIDGDYAGANAGAISTWFDSVNAPSTAATTLAADFTSVVYAQGVAVGTTKATILPAAGGSNNYGYKITRESVGRPATTDRIAGLTTYTSAADIGEIYAGDVLSIYEIVTATNLAVKFATHVMLGAEIRP